MNHASCYGSGYPALPIHQRIRDRGVRCLVAFCSVSRYCGYIHKTLAQVLILALLALNLSQAAVCTLTSNSGGWSAATWSGCTPGTSDRAVIPAGKSVTLNTDVSVFSVQNFGTLGWDGATHTLTINSTGSNPVGSGTATNPGLDATMGGIMADSGTLALQRGAGAGVLTITSPGHTNPIYIRHMFTGGGVTAPASILLDYVILFNAGVNSPGFTGVANLSDGGTLSANHGRTVGGYIGFESYNGGETFSNWHLESLTAASGILLSTNTGVTISGVWESNPLADGHTVECINPCSGLSMTNSGQIGTTAHTHNLFQVDVGSATMATLNTASGNAWKSLRTVARTDNDIAFEPNGQLATSATAWNIFGNSVEDAYTSVHISNNAVYQYNVYQGTNIHSGEGQGSLCASFGGGPTTCDHNMGYQKDSLGSIGVFGFDYPACSMIATHNTLILAGTETGNSNAFTVGEGITGSHAECRTNVVKYNLVAGIWSNGFANQNPETTYAADITVGGVGIGLWNNAASMLAGNTAYSTAGGLPAGQGWDNGITVHPNAIYSDVTLSPGIFPFLDPGRTMERYSAKIGLDGTAAALFACFAKADGVEGALTTGCTQAELYAWQVAGFQLVQRLPLAADGTPFGAHATPAYPTTVMP